MKKTLTTLAGAFLLTIASYAQTRVFKAVSNEMSSKFSTIYQDGALVGYINVTQLEKVSKDSFSYRIDIMDENLNDIGTINFRDLWLALEDVALEGDVLCLSYVKTDLYGKEFKLSHKFRREAAMVDVFVYNQFLNLDGKILGHQQHKVDVDLTRLNNGMIPTEVHIRHQPHLRNIPGKGFAVSFGDDRQNMVVAYTTEGQKLWEKKFVESAAQWYSMLTTPTEIYLLEKKKTRYAQGGYSVYSYAVANGKAYPVYRLEDKDGVDLRVTGFDIDPKTGRPFASGSMLHEKKGRREPIATRVALGLYKGVFTIHFNGPAKKDIKPVYSLWADGGNPQFSSKGRCIPTNRYMYLNSSFKDFEGNTYFSGTAMKKSFRPEGVLYLPFLTAYFAPHWGVQNLSKFDVSNGIVVKQDTTGKLIYSNTIPGSKGKMRGVDGMGWSGSLGGKEFYPVSNSDTRAKYLIMRDVQKTVIYDVGRKKILREIPVKDKSLLIKVYPAKEGHILVSEYDKKEKSTRISIEAV